MNLQKVGTALAVGAALVAVVGVAGAATAPRDARAFAPASDSHLVGVFPNDMLGSSAGGFMLYSDGRVVPLAGAPFYGDAVSKKLTDFVGMVTDDSGNGYWLVTRSGQAFSYGPACSGRLTGPAVPAGTVIAGAINSKGLFTGAFEMVSTAGKTFVRTCTDGF